MGKTVRAYAIATDAIAAEKDKAGNTEDMDITNVIALDKLELRDVGPNDVRFKVLAVSAEHNINHAALADTINIAEARGGKIYPGNSALGEVVEVGGNVTTFVPGDIVVTHCNGEPDEYGFPLRIWAYDQPESIGWYAEEAVVGDWQLIKAPLDCGLNLWEMAALPLRAPTAYHLWRRAIGIYRVKVPVERRATINVLGFGGGVSELFLQLAKAEGHNAYFCSGSPERREALEKQGIVGIDQKQFNRFAGKDDIKAFRKHVSQITNGEDMHAVCDMLRGPVFEAGLAVAARMGVNVSAGWQLSQVVTYNSTLMSVKQVTIDHTHYETPLGCGAATELYGRVFKPTVHKEIYAFEDLPRCFKEMHDNTQTGIPIIRVADEMPDSVKGLLEMTEMLLTEIDHVAIAVNDLEAAIKYYADAFGATVDHREVVESDGVEEALLKVAESYVQLLTPTRPDSPVAKALEKRGEGLHHIGYRVKDCGAALDAIIAAGGTGIDKAPRPGSRGTTVAFVHPKGSFGTLIELVQE